MCSQLLRSTPTTKKEMKKKIVNLKKKTPEKKRGARGTWTPGAACLT
jgi:hypothetical protein